MHHRNVVDHSQKAAARGERAALQIVSSAVHTALLAALTTLAAMLAALARLLLARLVLTALTWLLLLLARPVLTTTLLLLLVALRALVRILIAHLFGSPQMPLTHTTIPNIAFKFLVQRDPNSVNARKIKAKSP